MIILIIFNLLRTLTSAATMADVASGESTGLTPDKNEEENGSTEILNDVNADALREDTGDLADTSIYLDMEGTAGDADIDGGNLGGRGSSGRVRRTEVERLGGEVLPNTLRSRGGRRN